MLITIVTVHILSNYMTVLTVFIGLKWSLKLCSFNASRLASKKC